MTRNQSARLHDRSSTWVAMLAIVTLTFAAGCGGGSSDEANEVVSEDLLNWSNRAALTAAEDCDDALAGLQDHAIVQMELNLEANRRCWVDQASCHFRGDVGIDAPVLGAPPEAVNDGAEGDAPDDFSETNVQVEGVDEADRVKTDGTHIYALSDRDLVVMQSWPPSELQELARVPLRFWPQGLFLNGDRAVVLGYANLYEIAADAPLPDAGDGGSDPVDDTPGARPGDAAIGIAPGWYGHRSVAAVTIIDISDRANPRIVDEHFFEGDLVDSRRIDARIYLAINKNVWIDGLEYWPELGFEPRPSVAEIDAAFDAMRDRNEERIRARSLEDWLPLVWTADAGGTVTWSNGVALTACTDVHTPNAFSGQSLLSLATFDLDSGAIEGSTIQGSWGSVYASLDAVYIGSSNSEFFWWWRDAADAPTLKTHIHKFAFDRDGIARYTASGEVEGYAVNQFAFDEHEGHLRVATTDGFGWWNGNETESRVTVLAQNSGRLQQVGLVTGLGPGEQIFGVRFLGDQAYVVTFRQVDPLYVLDLSVPANPRVTGELKIPGFSSYIHPLADGFLLTAGRDGDDDGNIGGVKIEIFDVRDPANPVSVTTAVIGDGWNTWSEVLWDHKAFTYFRARNLLAIPVSGWVEAATPFGFWSEHKSELALFRISNESIETLPSISHADFFAEFGGDTRCRHYGGYGQAAIYRGLFADDFVYSLSQLGVQVHDTRALEAGAIAAVPILDANSFGPFDWEGCVGSIEVRPDGQF